MRGRGELTVRGMGASVRVRFAADADAASVDAVRSAWEAWERCVPAPGAPEADAPELPTIDVPAFGSDLDTMLAWMSGTLTLALLEQAAGGALLLHAAGVAFDDGRVVAFAAPSGGGKTTVAAELGRRFAYVSDEAVAVGFDGTVLAFPKPLSIVDGTRPGVKRQVAPAAAGLRPTPEGRLGLAAIVLLHRDDDHVGGPRVESVPLLPGIAELVPQLSYLTRMPEPLHTIARLIESSDARELRRVTYREAAELADVLPTLARPREAAREPADGDDLRDATPERLRG